jgi:hypothetical protein
MPARTADLLHRFLVQGEGRLSKRARSREFSALTDDEVTRLQDLYVDLHGASREGHEMPRE